MKKTDRARRNGGRLFRAARDQGRGYSISYKPLVVAYVIEAAVIVSGVVAGVQFANRFAGDNGMTSGATGQQVAALNYWGSLLPANHSQAWWMAIIATVTIAVAEMARIPLAQAVRSHRNFTVRMLAIVGVAMMCVVTTKSMSQVMEQMFHPRLRHVQTASADVKKAEGELATLVATRSAVGAKLRPLEQDVDDASKALSDMNKLIEEQGKAPVPREVKKTVNSTCRNKKGVKFRCKKTVTEMVQDPWVGQQFADQLPELMAKRDEAVTKRDAITHDVAAVDQAVAAQEEVITSLRDKQLTAVAESQLHSFTAMVFGKDPVEVTDGEVHWFLRIFVFVPAIMIAVTSTLLAMTAYTRLKPVTSRLAAEGAADVHLPVDDKDGTLAAFIKSVVANQNVNHNQKVA